MGRSGRLIALGCSWFLLVGCYQIPPEIPRDYIGSDPAPGWPPPAAYDRDPFHPANRLFQRLWIGLPGGDEPISAKESFDAADRIEIIGLLAALKNTGFTAASTAAVKPVFWVVLQADLLAVAARLGLGLAPDPASGVQKDLVEEALGPDFQAAGFPGKLTGAALRLAAPVDGAGAPPEIPAHAALPPVLREPGWVESARPPGPGLRPCAADLRWTRILERRQAGGPPGGTVQAVETALLRLRIGVRGDGEPVLLPLGSEAWILSPSENGGPPRSRVFHLRRVLLAAGEDPWVEVSSMGRIAVLDPADPRRPLIAGKVSALCAGCHPGPGIEARPPASPASSPAAGAADQLEDARRALR